MHKWVQGKFDTGPKPVTDCVLRLVEKIHIEAMDSTSGESLCFFLSCWGGAQLLNFTCA